MTTGIVPNPTTTLNIRKSWHMIENTAVTWSFVFIKCHKGQSSVSSAKLGIKGSTEAGFLSSLRSGAALSMVVMQTLTDNVTLLKTLICLIIVKMFFYPSRMSLNFLEGLSASILPNPWESKKVLLDQVNNKHFIHFVCLFKKTIAVQTLSLPFLQCGRMMTGWKSFLGRPLKKLRQRQQLEKHPKLQLRRWEDFTSNLCLCEVFPL